MEFHYDWDRTEDFWFYGELLGKNAGRFKYAEKIISLNGVGRSGKTKQALLLSSGGYGVPCPMYTIRDRFVNQVYSSMRRTKEQKSVDVLGISSIAWLAAEFHWRVKPLINCGQTVILDHYIADYYVDMLAGCGNINLFMDFLEGASMPGFQMGKHFFLDIDYDTYKSRGEREDLLGGGELKDELEVEKKFFINRRRRYLDLVDQGFLIHINGSDTPENVYDEIRSKIKET